MPSIQIGALSGGVPLWPTPAFGGNSGSEFGLGVTWPWSHVNLRLTPEVSGIVYVCLPPPISGSTSLGTINSGVALSGGFLDGMPMVNGDSYKIPKARLTSGFQTPRIHVLAGASGIRMYWEFDTEYGGD